MDLWTASIIPEKNPPLTLYGIQQLKTTHFVWSNNRSQNKQTKQTNLPTTIHSLHFPGRSPQSGAFQLFVHDWLQWLLNAAISSRHRLSSEGHLAVCPTFIPADHAPPLQPKARTQMVTPTGMGSPGSGFYLEITSFCSSGSYGCTQNLRFPSCRHFHMSYVLYFFYFFI